MSSRRRNSNVAHTDPPRNTTPWATMTWDRVIGNVLVRAYRLSARDQARVSRTIAGLRRVNRDYLDRAG